MIRVAARRRSASLAQAEAALAALGDTQGIYFGVDGGIAGLHPLQATLVDRPALALRLFGDGVAIEAISGFGRALLRQPALAAWAANALRGAGVSTLARVRSFMSSFEPSPDLMLIGALPFAAHRLRGGGGAEALGVLFLPEHFFRRDAAGAWESVTLSTDASAHAEAAASPRTGRTTAEAVNEPHDDLPPGGYAAMVARAVDLLKQGSLVSLTLSQAYRRRVDLPPAEAFRRLREANPAPATFFFNDGTGECVFGASPDLQLVIRDRLVTALPVCGTVARGTGAVAEAQALRELINEEVDAASLAVCTDALRNDLAPLCEPGSLHLEDRRRPMSLATVIHAVDRLAGRLRPGCDAWDAIAATAAPVMVTGTPRASALAAIEQLEASPRGWYGGMVVQVAGAGDALVGTILRAAAVRDGVAQVRTGGDLLADSSPAREERESRLKTRSLWRAFGLEPGGPGAASAELRANLPSNVTVLAEGDPFAAALADCLAGLGVSASGGGAVSVLAETRRDAPRERCVAIGDAAVTLLEREGFAVREITPQQGYLLRCIPTADALIAQDGFIAARYLRRDLAGGELVAGWVVWARGEDGSPQVLVHSQRRLACLLMRPDSLLSQPAARDLLAAALACCAI